MGTKTKNKKKIILFDGVCNMCVWSVQFIIKNDINDVFRFASLQSKQGEEFIREYALSMNSIVLVENDKIKTQSTAVLSILYNLNTFWRLLCVLYIIPYPIRDFVYMLISKTRYSFFGKRNKCMVPNENINSKFLSL